jgi:hypothetical protein
MATSEMAAPAARVITGEPEVQRSSCEIKTSPRGFDSSVKVYAGSPVGEAVDECFAEYGRLQRMLRLAQANDWAETLAAVAARPR